MWELYHKWGIFSNLVKRLNKIVKKIPAFLMKMFKKIGDLHFLSEFTEITGVFNKNVEKNRQLN